MATYVFRNGNIIPKEEAYAMDAGPQVIRDIGAYKSMITGEMIDGRTAHRAHLRTHGCVEIGTDTSHMNKPRPQAPKTDERKRVLASQFSDMSDRQISRMIGQEIKNRSRH